MPDESRPSRPSSIMPLTGLGALMMFSLWCLIDYSLVTSPRYPQGIFDYDWVIASSPVFAFALLYWIAGIRRTRRPLLDSLLATLLAIPCCVALILFLGLPLHGALGGHL